MRLKHNVDSTIYVDYVDLEELVTDVFGYEWSFVAWQECGNDTDHSFIVKAEPLTTYDLEELRDWVRDKSGNPYPALILQALAYYGFIDEGNYLITVSW